MTDEQTQLNAARYEYLRERLLAADFDYMESGECALVFSWPDTVPVSADCDAMLDQAMAQAAAKETQQ